MLNHQLTIIISKTNINCKMYLKLINSFVLVVIVCNFYVTVNGQPILDSDKKEVNPMKEINEIQSSYLSDIESGRQSTPPAASGGETSGVSSIISGLLGQVGTAITPSLGALSPLATAVGPSVNNGLTSLLTNAFSGLFRVVSRGDLPISGYETYLVNIPNQGSYILLAKSPEPAFQEPIISSPTETASVPKPSSTPQSQFIAELNRLGINALVNSNPALMQQQVQKSNIIPTASTISAQAPAAASIVNSPKDNNVMIPLSFFNSLTGSAINSIIAQQQQRKQILEPFNNDINLV